MRLEVFGRDTLCNGCMCVQPSTPDVHLSMHAECKCRDDKCQIHKIDQTFKDFRNSGVSGEGVL